jgi:hypothetical protein
MRLNYSGKQYRYSNNVPLLSIGYNPDDGLLANLE